MSNSTFPELFPDSIITNHVTDAAATTNKMSIPSFPTINNPNIQAALAEVADQESGTLINDHYSPSFYANRRGNFLGRHADFKHFNNGLFGIAQHDTFSVFGDSNDDLSVQEIRRREIINEIVPFLPLPTTSNTESLDDFAGLPDSEWAEGKPGVYPTRSPTPSPPPAPVRLTDDDAAEGRTRSGGMTANGLEIDQSGQQADDDDDDVFLAQGANRRSRSARQAAMAGSSRRGDAAAQPPVVQGMQYLPGILNQLDRLYPTYRDGDGTYQAAPSTAAPRSQGARKAPGRIARETASAYPNRPTGRTLKYRRGTKRPLVGPNDTAVSVSSDSEAGNDSSYSGDEASPPPRKKLKINPPRKPRAAGQQAPSAADGRASSGVVEVAPRKAAAPKRKVKPSASRTSKDNSIDAIVSGAALPRTVAQAGTADDARYALLLAAHQRPFKARKKKAPTEPDMMPEYFHTSNFPAGQEADQVRCVCGVVVDDGREMVCCDGEDCSVWQHVGCVGEAAPEDLDGGAYLCHNCDPWAHRRVIQGLRRGNAIDG